MLEWARILIEKLMQLDVLESVSDTSSPVHNAMNIKTMSTVLVPENGNGA